MCCYWLRPFLSGKGRVWIGLCFSVRAGFVQRPGSEGKGRCPCQMARPPVGERPRTSPVPQRWHRPNGIVTRPPRPGCRGTGPLIPALPPQHHFAREADQGGGRGRQGNISWRLVRSQQRLLPEALCPRRAVRKSSHRQPGASPVFALPAPCRRMPASPCSISTIAALSIHYSHTIHLLKVYNSVIFSIYSELCKNIQSPSPVQPVWISGKRQCGVWASFWLQRCNMTVGLSLVPVALGAFVYFRREQELKREEADGCHQESRPAIQKDDQEDKRLMERLFSVKPVMSLANGQQQITGTAVSVATVATVPAVLRDACSM